MGKLNIIVSITSAYEQKLREVYITSIEGLLAVCATKKGRATVAAKTGIPDNLILKWANHADLNRIKGIGGDYAELLEAAGILTVEDLTKRDAETLAQELRELNNAKRIVKKLPTLRQSTAWVSIAQAIPKVMQY